MLSFACYGSRCYAFFITGIPSFDFFYSIFLLGKKSEGLQILQILLLINFNCSSLICCLTFILSVALFVEKEIEMAMSTEGLGSVREGEEEVDMDMEHIHPKKKDMEISTAKKKKKKKDVSHRLGDELVMENRLRSNVFTEYSQSIPERQPFGARAPPPTPASNRKGKHRRY